MKLKLTSALIHSGFTQSKLDYSLITKRQNNDIVIILVYVDDLLITGSDQEIIQEAKTILNENFKMKDLGELRFFLEIEFARSSRNPYEPKEICTGAFQVLSQFMNAPKQSHYEAALREVNYRILHKTGRFHYLMEIKKQSTVSRSSAEDEYRSMATIVAELVWVHGLLEELGMKVDLPMELHCDNKAALQIASNPMYHERTKHIEIDCHFIRE
ncbi:PREDICTED: uncharacterized protein LOC109207428 [Nicotiana attenuata]|uniref:uncharacterized protein LOC109207428 n=1 Tax=Nicotiana attenuata TaxID=49451 RepID=UPI0009053CC8|nr:PREDICTED: uncharacterized protein LOC109207428 [Nicotiana attenuata]